MRILWRTLPRLALPAALGLGLAYLATGFLPRAEPALRPPEELRAHGQGFDEESPLRAILERNVLRLELPLFSPPDSPLAPPTVPTASVAALSRPEAPTLHSPSDPALDAFATPEFVLGPGRPAGGQKASATLSGGSSVLGLVAAPDLSAAGVNAGAEARIENFRLVGVAAGGPKPTAMLQVDAVTATLRPGEQVRGWTLVEIRPGQALLRRGQQSHWLQLSAPGASK